MRIRWRSDIVIVSAGCSICGRHGVVRKVQDMLLLALKGTTFGLN
jgi:hypothetical protein